MANRYAHYEHPHMIAIYQNAVLSFGYGTLEKYKNGNDGTHNNLEEMIDKDADAVGED
jgi:hypothetical protein